MAAAELLANATKHSGANKIDIRADITDSGNPYTPMDAIFAAVYVAGLIIFRR